LYGSLSQPLTAFAPNSAGTQGREVIDQLLHSSRASKLAMNLNKFARSSILFVAIFFGVHNQFVPSPTLTQKAIESVACQSFCAVFWKGALHQLSAMAAPTSSRSALGVLL
jgi:hypothetical protein